MGGGSGSSYPGPGVTPAVQTNSNLYGIVDMGSNGIRFSITDLSATTARILPTLYQYRLGISLYEAQYDEDGNQIPIPEDIQAAVIGGFLRFEIFCSDFGVPFKNIRIIATEATRKATNGEEFVARVAKETGLEVEVLSQAGEGETGAWGIASSSYGVEGLVMDLGGGSTQITWIIMNDGKMQTSPKGAISFPYGAAALTQRLELIHKKSKTHEDEEDARGALRKEMKENFAKAYDGLQIPPELAKKAEREGGFTLYLSGGGFRGWGYLLLYMAQKHRKSYPISIINGFVARKKDFTDTEKLKQIARQADSIFRVSDRRRAQVPAVAFLVNVLAEALPHGIKEAHFCQGGVREGILFKSLSPEIRMQGPIEVATSPFARPLASKLARLLNSSLPEQKSDITSLDIHDLENGWIEVPSFEALKHIPESLNQHIIHAFANMLYLHSDMTKELSSASALYTTSSGALADVHGTSHHNRALLALLLEARYTGDLPPRDYSYRQALRRLLTPQELWWINYIGAVAMVLSRIYPAGSEDDVSACYVNCECGQYDGGRSGHKPALAQRLKRPHHKKPHLSLEAQFANDLGKKGHKPGLRLTFHLRMREHNRHDPMKVHDLLEDLSRKIEKVGKKKHWVQTVDYYEGQESGYPEDLGHIVHDSESENDFKSDEESHGWGMKIKVDVKVEYPIDKNGSQATRVV